MTRVAPLAILIALLFSSALPAADDWIAYGGDPGGLRYSSLEQLTRKNVRMLEPAWTYRTGELPPAVNKLSFFGLHATPILAPPEAGGSLLLCSAFNKLIALDPATGEERWVYDPEIRSRPFNSYKCRGVTLWQDKQAKPEAACAWRVFMGTTHRRLVALDARTGQGCEDFGEAGVVNVDPLVKALPQNDNASGVTFWAPPAVVRDVVVLGSAVNGKQRRSAAASGMLRAFDTRSGELRWTFDPIPRNDGDPQAANWDAKALQTTGGGNAWSMLSVDEKRGLIFAPTASPSADFFGGTRPGDNRYANSVVALRAENGKVAWHFQITHHDVWNSDVPAQPILTTVRQNKRDVPVVVQLTKQGFVFVLNRDTGEPVYPVEERAVPTDGVPGEVLSPTQPFPTYLPPLVPQNITPDDAWGVSFYDQAKCREAIANRRYGPIYTPPSFQGTVMFPQMGGGANWSGGAIDTKRGWLITNVAKFPYLLQMHRAEDLDQKEISAPGSGRPQGPPGKIKGTDYAYSQGPLLSPLGAPCTAPPWHTLLALDLNTGKIQWEVPIGSIEQFAPVPLPITLGAPGAGGAIVTAGGLVFMGGTPDEKFRAIDIRNGKTLWTAKLPTAAMATPMTYEVDGLQHVVVAAGGHQFLYPDKAGDWIMAFRLPADEAAAAGK
jgi:quinoprotein glucose dehydrogenase